ncbi:MAG: hypothetical protein C0484_08975 [Rhodospirillum sp.]|nr:hypothetical protein [Rhodospirillum sp.]
MTFADVLSSAATIFIDPALLGAMVAGMSMGMVFGAMPGLSAKMGILLLMPLMFGMDPAVGIVLLLSMHAVVHSGGSIPSILFGVPGGAAEAATVLDGFTMAKKGAAGEALGASMSASAVGGALGAICYFVLLPGFTAVGKTIGAPEYLLLALLGLSAVATLSHASPLKGLAMGALGVLAGTVGMDHATGTPRFVFGFLELWDGIDILILVTGLFAIPELMDLARHNTMRPRGEFAAAGCSYRDVLRGMVAVWHHRWLTLRTSFIGVGIGMMPGLGAEVAAWLAYGHAVQSSKDKSRFGQGAVEGVIAPETANNSKEGGGFLPTIALGIPSTSAMALVVAALAILGLPVGPTMTRDHGDLVALIGWTILWSNLLAVVFFLAVLPLLGRTVYMRIEYVAPLVITVAITGTLIDHAGWWSIATLLGVSLAGCLLANFDWPRAPLLLGFIMGKLAEINLIKTVELYDWTALERWPSLLLIGALLLILWHSLRSRRNAARRTLQNGDRLLTIALCCLFLVACATAWPFPLEARMLPLIAGGAGAVLTGIIIVRSRPHPAPPNEMPTNPRPVPWRLLAMFAGYLATIPLIGALPASALYAALHCMVELRSSPWRAVSIAALVAVSIWVLFALWLRQPVFGAWL